jgi:hypothetical protein
VAALFKLMQVDHSELLPDNVPVLFPAWEYVHVHSESRLSAETRSCSKIDLKDPNSSIPKP